MRRLFILLGLAVALWAGAPDLDRARNLYNLTDFDQSLKVLQAAPDKDAAVYALMGRNLYMLGDYKRSTEALERAVAAAPSSSEYALWLGRAYGRRAETSSPLTAPGQASKAREYFERAVQLDPHSVEGLSDLFEYCLEAPGFLGGGMDKARALIPRMAVVNPAEGYWAEARIAEKRKEYGAAEAQLRRAIEAAPQQVESSSISPSSWPARAAFRKPTRAWRAPNPSRPELPSCCTPAPISTSIPASTVSRPASCFSAISPPS